MRKKLIVALCMLLMFPSTTFANQCANTIINKTKNNLGSASGFTDNVCRPHLAILARHPVRRHWAKMSASEQEQQMRYACGVFYSVAGKLAKLNPAKIKWVGNIGIFEKKKITLGFTGKCIATTACFEDKPCLQSIITDYRKL